MSEKKELPAAEKLSVSLREAAVIAGVGPDTVREWVARGLPHIWTKGRGKIVILRTDLAEWMAKEARLNASSN